MTDGCGALLPALSVVNQVFMTLQLSQLSGGSTVEATGGAAGRGDAEAMLLVCATPAVTG